VRLGRVGLLAVPLIMLNAGWIAHSEMRTSVTELTISIPFIGVIFLLFLLTLANSVVRLLTQKELLLIYTALCVSSVVSGFGHFGLLLPFLVAPFRTPGGSLSELEPLLPKIIGPRDPDVLKGFYEGHSSFFQPEILRAWAGPLCFWGGFLFLLLWTNLCLAAIFRRRWQEQEYLAFPTLALPLAMTDESAALYKNRLMWLGFMVPLGFHSLNSLASLYPSLPTFPINRAVDYGGSNLPFPWNGIGYLPLCLHPAGVGMGYLVNTDVAFSLWFFFLVRKALNVWGVTMGWRQPGYGGWGEGPAPEFPYLAFQSWGAWLALAVGAVWTGRHYLRSFLHESHTEEALAARPAVAGAALGFLGLCALIWVWGGSLWYPMVFLGVYFLLMVAMARLASETAVLSPLLVWVDPQSILLGVIGPRSLAPLELVQTGMLSWFNLDYRAAPMAHLMQLLALQRVRRLAGVLLGAAVLAILSSALWVGQLYYTQGAGSANVNAFRVDYGSSPWTRVLGWLHQPTALSTAHAIGGMTFGLAFTLLLTALRSRFATFPLSQAAYALDMSWGNDLFWCDLLLAWTIKTFLLRYGGIGRYRQALPFFLGLILGDFVTGAAWSIVGTLLRQELYRTFPN
jgi:hypothetical protein